MFSNNRVRKLALLALVALVIGVLPVVADAQATKNGITSPKDGATVGGTGVVQGYANDPNFSKWQLDLLPGGDPNAAIFLALGTTPGEFTFSKDTTGFPNGQHALRLRVVRQDSNYDEYITKFTIANPAAPTQAAAAAPSQSAAAGVASTEANKALVRQFVAQVLNARNPNAVDQFDAPNFKRYLSAVAAPLGIPGHKQRLAGIFAAFPDIQFTIDDVVAEGDRVVYRMTARGTQKGPFMGIPATGKPVTATSIEIARIENGKYVELWGGPDAMDIAQQLGAALSAK